MSVINQMLMSLDKRRAQPPAEAGEGVVVTPTPAATGLHSRRLQVVAVLGAAVVSLAAFGDWPAWTGKKMNVPMPVAMGADPVPMPVGLAASAVPLAAALVASAVEQAASAVTVAAAVQAVLNDVPARAVPSSALPPALTAALTHVPLTPAPVLAPVRRLSRASEGLSAPDAGEASLAPRAEPVVWTRSASSGPAPISVAVAPVLVPPSGPSSVEKKPVATSTAQRAALAYAQASELAASGHNSQAIEKALDALAHEPDHLPARQLGAMLLYENRRFNEAASLLQAGLQRQPQQPQLAYLLARLKVESGDAAGALAVLAQAQGLSADAHALRAGVLMQQAHHKEAIAAYEHVLRLEPANASAWLGLGIALDAEGQAEPSRQAFQRAKAIGSLQGELLTFLDQKLAVAR